MGFFEKRQGDRFNASVAKDLRHTNLNQSHMLDYPREVVVREVGVFIDDAMIGDERDETLDASCELVLRPSSWWGDPVRRIEFALGDFPNNCRDTGVHEILTRRAAWRDCYPLEDNRMPPTLMLQIPEAECVRIKPGDLFYFNIRFNKSRERVTQKRRIMVALGGQIFLPK